MEGNENEFVCPHCNSTYNTSDAYYNCEDTAVCEDCFYENYGYCDDCGDLLDMDELRYIKKHDKLVCTHCIDHHYETCVGCGEYEYACDALLVIESGEERYVCSKCSNDYEYCEECQYYHHNDNIVYNHGSGESFCTMCYDKLKDKEIIKGYHYHKDYLKTFYDVDGESSAEKEDVMYFGIENEIVNRVNELEEVALSIQKKLGDIMYFEEDGSISEGFETITQPMSYGFLKTKFKDYGEAFNEAKELETIVDDTCGMHIHVNRSYITKDYSEMKNFEDLLKALFEFFQDEIKQLSQRKRFNYCAFLTSCLTDENAIKHLVKGDKTRKTVVNTNNYKTIEIRVFKATLDEEVYFANIEFTRNVIDILKDKTIDVIKWEDIIGYNVDSHNLLKLVENLNINSSPKVFSKTI